MRLVVAAVVMLIMVGLQVAFFGNFRPFGIMPNLILVLVIVAALWLEATSALTLAIIAGMALDLASGTDFGLRTAFYSAAALAVIAGRQFGLHTDSLLTAAALVVMGTVLFDGAILLNLGQGIIQWAHVVRTVAVETVANLAVLVVLYAARNIFRSRHNRVSSELKRGSWL